MRSSLLFCARVVACCAIFAAPPAFADKTDVVTLQNGDRLTGEVKTLERGLLTFKTDTMGTVQIEWDKVASLESRFLFDVELTSGQRHFGRLVHAPESGRLTIAQGDEAHSLELADTIRISQMDTAGALRDLVDGSVSFGFTYSDSTSISQLTLGAGLSRRNAVRLWDFNLDVTESDAPGTTDRAQRRSPGKPAGSSTTAGSRPVWECCNETTSSASTGGLWSVVAAGATWYRPPIARWLSWPGLPDHSRSLLTARLPRASN